MRQVEETNSRGGRRRKWKNQQHYAHEAELSAQQGRALPAGTSAGKAEPSEALKEVKEVAVLREFPLCMCKKCLWEKHMVLVGEAEEQTALSCTGLGATAAIMAQEKRPVKRA